MRMLQVSGISVRIFLSVVLRGFGVSRFVMGVVVRAGRAIDLFSETSRGPSGSRRLHGLGVKAEVIRRRSYEFR